MTFTFPDHLLPTDGRFGAGPSKVRPAQLAPIVAPESIMGTSHRKPAVKNVVASIRSGLTELFQLPDGYEVLLGNGGASALWDAASFTLVEAKAQASVYGVFSDKAARALKRAPWLDEPEIREVEPGQVIECTDSDVDAYFYTHNETSTGATLPIKRFGGAGVGVGIGAAGGAAVGASVGTAGAAQGGPLVVVDGTSIAGAKVFDASAVDFYYFSPQKAFASDGGIWFAFASPAALERIERIAADRWVPDFLNLQLAVNNSRKEQTLNTPALATLVMMNEQVKWMLEQGGLAAMEERSAASSGAIYEWAEAREFASPFISDPAFRSPVVATVDFDDAIDTPKISALLREQGVLDIDPYRSLNRNQFRIGTFPAVELSDVQQLLACIDYAVEHL